jgi:hypothetical protein
VGVLRWRRRLRAGDGGDHIGSVRSFRDRDVWLRVAAASGVLVVAASGSSALLVLPVGAALLAALVAVEVAGRGPDGAAGAATGTD